GKCGCACRRPAARTKTPRERPCRRAACRRRKPVRTGQRRPGRGSPSWQAFGALMIASLSPASLVTLLLWQKRFGVELSRCRPRESGDPYHRSLEIPFAVPHCEETAYGSPLSRGRQRIGCAPHGRSLIPQQHTSDGGACLTSSAPILAGLVAVVLR